jgi:simple sugar transport system ATP-binding protein
MGDSGEVHMHTTTAASAAPVAVRARLVGIGKNFGALRALDDVTLPIHVGEIHAVLGENGAGKSTLMRILAGTLHPDEGHIELQGRKVSFKGRRQGAERGIGLVQQHYGLIDELTGIENCLLGHPHVGGWTNVRKTRQAMLQTAQDFGLAVDPNRIVGTLSIGERQRLEILIALTIGADLLILDEPTAALVSSEIKILIPVLRRLATRGMSIIYITHKLDEVMEIADQVTVLRRGKVSGNFPRTALAKDLLTEAMIGSLPVIPAAGHPEPGDEVVSLHAVSVAPTATRQGLIDVDLAVRRREIVGVAGIAGNGQEALAEVLRGLAQPSSGRISRVSSHAAYIPEDRATDGLAMTLPISDNAILYRHREPRFSKLGHLDAGAIGAFASELARAAGIPAPRPTLPAGALSGGNQQKLVIARELDMHPNLIIAHNPYRGLDVGAANAVRGRLLDARDAGAAIVLISPDLDELFDIAGRIVFLSQGRIVGTVDPRNTAIEEVGHMLSGAHP